MLAHNVPGLQKAFEENEYIVYQDSSNITKSDKNIVEAKVMEWIEQDNITDVFSMNFYPDVADICLKYNVFYISWIVDCPHPPLLSKSVMHANNRIFIFDYLLWEEIHNLGCENAFYLPLSTDVGLFEQVLNSASEEMKNQYRCDVSFMGNMYDKAPHNLYDQITYLPPYAKGYLEGLIKAQQLVWGKNFIHTAIADKVWNELRETVKLNLESNYDKEVYEAFVETIIHKKIAQIERKEACGGLAERFDFRLYSGSDTSYNKEIDNRGYIDYIKEMPLVFNGSKINVNITLHGISTGIPLRVLDIMACGGFCLTNYQEDLGLYFENGVDLVFYSDFEDMYRKIDYYLVHEEERKAIALSGYEKVKREFEYSVGVRKMLDMINRDETNS